MDVIGERRIDDKLNRLRTKIFFNLLDLLIAEQAYKCISTCYNIYVETIANAIP